MSFLRRLFGFKINPPGVRSSTRLAERVRELERQAEGAPLGTRGTLLNRAGDVCMRGGDHRKALEYFRQAIDLLLEDEQPEPARGVAKKIIRVHPETVRTHCTLIWMDLGLRQHGAALKSLRDYARAAEKRAQTRPAGAQILEMARVTAHQGFLEEAAEVLERMGFPRDAEQVGRWLAEGGSPQAHGDPEELKGYCFSAAIASKGIPSRKGPGA